MVVKSPTTITIVTTSFQMLHTTQCSRRRLRLGGGREREGVPSSVKNETSECDQKNVTYLIDSFQCSHLMLKLVCVCVWVWMRALLLVTALYAHADLWWFQFNSVCSVSAVDRLLFSGFVLFLFRFPAMSSFIIVNHFNFDFVWWLFVCIILTL